MRKTWLLLGSLWLNVLSAGPVPDPFLPGTGVLARPVPRQWTFEEGLRGWQTVNCKAEKSGEQAVDGLSSLRMDVRFPLAASIYFEGELRCDEFEKVRLSVLVPEAAPKGVKVLFYLKDKDGLYFQYVHHGKLAPGKWGRITIDISEASAALRPQGSFSRWNRLVSSRMNLMGIKLLSEASYSGPIYVDNVERVRMPVRAGKVGILDYRPGPSKVEVFDKFEVSFRLNREFSNPFDPDEVRVDAQFRSHSSGRTFSIPAFYSQDYVRRNDRGRKEIFMLTDTNRSISKEIEVERQETLTPVGAPCWKVRFSPLEPGEHSYHLLVRAGKERVSTRWKSFTAVPSERRGFVRVCKSDPKYFEFDNGDFYYPIGHNVRSPFDERWWAVVLGRNELPPDRGTYTYDTLLKKMHDNGENFAEIWMASWWLAIEWTSEWRGYHGLTRYNLENAWKLDYMLELAEKHDIYFHLVFDNHGKGSTWCDPEWEDNPYNAANGGPVESAEDYFSDRDAIRLYQKTLRYIVARWGYASRIMGFELWSELDLVGNGYNFFKNPVKAAWHREIGQYLRNIDQFGHLVTTHYSTDHSRIDPRVASLPEMDYVVVDAYRNEGGIIPLLQTTYRVAGQYGKPCFVTEYGGSPWATTASQVIPLLKADLHAGLWSTYMSNAAATPLLWWFEFIDHQDQYFRLKALAEFAKGEDRRNRNLRSERAIVSSKSGYLFRLGAMTLKNQEMAYVWVYDRIAMERWPTEGAERTFQEVSIVVSNLGPGDYDVEVWDTHKGVLVESKNCTANDRGRGRSTLTIPLPEFTTDCALKVKKVE